MLNTKGPSDFVYQFFELLTNCIVVVKGLSKENVEP